MTSSNHPPSTAESREIDFLDHVPSYSVFLEEYMRPLKPLIFDDPQLVETWHGRKCWVTTDGDVDMGAFVGAFKGVKANVVFSGVGDGRIGYGEEKREEVVLDNAFLELWKQVAADPARMLYVKDLHLCLVRPDLEAYRVYELFRDDWLNAYALHNTEDDYRFLYLGTDGSSTPFHHDVYLSHSWSTSLCGIKRWTMLAPEYATLLMSRVTGEPVLDLDDSTVNGNEDEFPGLEEAKKKVQVVWQYPGETIFVPSGWYHCVRNFGQTLSINHNWANVTCLAGMYSALGDQVDKAASLLSDVRESVSPEEFWKLVYGNVVRPSWGWSFEDFWTVVEWVVNHPMGGDKWGGCDLASSGDESKRVISRLARRWLDREEAVWMPDLRHVVEPLC